MKILHYINNLGSGGAEKLLTDILPLMKQKGHEVHLVYSNGLKNVPRFQEIIAEAGITIINFDTSFYRPVQVMKLIKLLRKEQYDIVHAHLFPSQYWLALASFFKLSNTRFIKTEHSVFNERKQYKVLRPLEKFVYGRYDKTIGITAQVTENLSSWLQTEDNIVTILNGVNLNQIEEAKRSIDLKAYSFLELAKFNLLMVGRFDGLHKDQLSLIHALAHLPEDVYLYFAGEGPALESIRKQTEELQLHKRVCFLGVRTDVYCLMSLVDLNVLSTNTEGLSGVTLESLASGKPFIGSDVEGVNNIVPDKSFLFPKQNPVALANKILDVKNDSAFSKELVSKAACHVKKYDIADMVEKYLEIYQNG